MIEGGRCTGERGRFGEPAAGAVTAGSVIAISGRRRIVATGEREAEPCNGCEPGWLPARPV